MVLNRERVTACVAWLVATTLGLVRPAAAVDAPPPERLPELQAACDAAWRVRITGRAAVFETSHLRLDSLGVTLPAASTPPALITIGDAQEPGRRLLWSEIEQLHTERSRAWAGLGVGCAVGALISAAAISASGPDIASTGDSGVVFYGVLFTLITSGAGLLLAMSNPALEPLYP